MQIELRTLGTIDLRTPDGLAARSVLVQPKQLGVLVYLTLAVPEGFVRRDTLTGLFWPDLDQQHARTVLRKTVFHLRHALGGETVIGRGEEELALAPQAVWCDVLALRELLAAGRPAEALALYRGDLLAGFYLPETPAFEHWLDGERQSVRRLAASAAWRAAEAEEAAGNTPPPSSTAAAPSPWRPTTRTRRASCSRCSTVPATRPARSGSTKSTGAGSRRSSSCSRRRRRERSSSASARARR